MDQQSTVVAAGMSTIEILISIVIVLIITYFYGQKKPRGYPPGPWGFPFVGHLPLVGNAPFRTLEKWKKKYGPIVAVDFGQFPTVAISDYKLIREANAMMEFSGRPNLQPFLDRSGGQRRGVIFSDGPEWMEQRRFTFRHLKNFGFGKNCAENVINDEYGEVIDFLKRNNGNPVSIQDMLHVANVNAIWVLATSQRFQKSDPDLTLLLNSIRGNIEENNGLAAAGMFFPWLTKTFPKLLGYEKMMKDLGPLLEFLDKPIKEHKENHIPGQPKDFLDAYLDEIKKTTDINSSFYGPIGEISMRTVLLDLFTAGSETTNTTLVYYTIYLALNPRVQCKLHDLIDSEIGRSRRPLLSDRDRLPYLEATTLEVLRLSSIISTGIFRNTVSDVNFHGYFIPKDTMVIMNLFNCNHDVNYWKDPQEFRPERFLAQDSSQDILIQHEAFLAFGSGKRECPGKKLSLNQIFLFIVSLLQNFEITFDPENPPSTEPIVSFVLIPQPHKLRYLPRTTSSTNST